MDSLFQFNKLRTFIILLVFVPLSSCVTPPPSDLNNVCRIFREYPKWYAHAKDVERRWLVPVPVQMAIIHQESKFQSHAKPPRTRFLGFIPWSRPSSATGYAQALHGTWKEYKQNNGGLFSSRHSFADGVDFIGWYANTAHRRAGINRADAYSLYLAYHEGVGGYMRKTYLRKSWLMLIARKVKARSQSYAMQLNSCRASLRRHSWL
ncbi:MAG: hypothetical protein QM652_01640 [Legionella sp.]|uniref:transglycosylase SLT domain-containing protein n=1 Tax=Legionella sp. TaxID=459 RepID=UPI0039E58E43